MPSPVHLVLSSAARSAVSTGYSASTRGRVTIAIGRISAARLIAITGTIAIITDGRAVPAFVRLSTMSLGFAGDES
jgi:hypothetical protein